MSDHSDADEDVPPLEDFSDHFAQLELQKQQTEATVAPSPLAQPSTAAPTQPFVTHAAQLPKAAKEPTREVLLPAQANTSARGSASSATTSATEPRSSAGQTLKTATCEADSQNSKSSSSRPKSTSAKTSSVSSASFGGFSKGFLSGGGSAKTARTKVAGTVATPNDSKSSTRPSIDDSIPYITAAKSKADPSSTNDLTLPEVQAALTASQPLLANTKEWLTPDLQLALARSPIIGPRLADPKFSSLLEDFQNNPQDTLRNNQSNPEMRAFLQEFCGIMGEHFTKLGEEQGDQTDPGNGDQSELLRPTKITKTSSSSAVSSSNGGMTDEDQRRMTEILQRPDIQHILKCQEIQEIFQLARTDPEEGSRRMRTSTPRIQGYVKTLVDAGLLAFQS